MLDFYCATENVSYENELNKPTKRKLFDDFELNELQFSYELGKNLLKM